MRPAGPLQAPPAPTPAPERSPPPLRQASVSRPAGFGRVRLAAQELGGRARRLVARVGSRLRAGWLALRGRERLRNATKLCLGSGSAPLAGWTNVDLDGSPDVRLDLRFRIPLPDGSVQRIYSEHLIEHLSRDDGLRLLRECRRLLAPQGVLRVATPDLAFLVEAYRGEWRDQDWLQRPEYRWIDSAASMLNQAFRGWGHMHLYDLDELERRVREAGFAATRRCEIGASEHPELAGLETRADSKLILEAWGRREEPTR